MSKDVIDISEALAKRLDTKHSQEVNRALDNLWNAISGGNAGWIDYGQREKITEQVRRLQADHFPRIHQRGIQEFLTTYDRLVVEFPHLVEMAREELEQEQPNG